MNSYTIATTVACPYEEAVEKVRAALEDQGFGILTEIDIRATMKAKLDLDVPPQIILGACQPSLAHRAMEADPSIATVLPCNVVVRAESGDTAIVEALDPDAMLGLAGENETLRSVATDARGRLTAALAALPTQR